MKEGRIGHRFYSGARSYHLMLIEGLRFGTGEVLMARLREGRATLLGGLTLPA